MVELWVFIVVIAIILGIGVAGWREPQIDHAYWLAYRQQERLIIGKGFWHLGGWQSVKTVSLQSVSAEINAKPHTTTLTKKGWRVRWTLQVALRVLPEEAAIQKAIICWGKSVARPTCLAKAVTPLLYTEAVNLIQRLDLEALLSHQSEFSRQLTERFEALLTHRGLTLDHVAITKLQAAHRKDYDSDNPLDQVALNWFCEQDKIQENQIANEIILQQQKLEQCTKFWMTQIQKIDQIIQQLQMQKIASIQEVVEKTQCSESQKLTNELAILSQKVELARCEAQIEGVPLIEAAEHQRQITVLAAKAKAESEAVTVTVAAEAEMQASRYHGERLRILAEAETAAAKIRVRLSEESPSPVADPLTKSSWQSVKQVPFTAP